MKWKPDIVNRIYLQPKINYKEQTIVGILRILKREVFNQKMEYLHGTPFILGLVSGVITAFLIPVFYELFSRLCNYISRRIFRRLPSEMPIELQEPEDSRSPDTINSVGSTTPTEEKDSDEEDDEIQSAISQTRRKRRKRKRNNDSVEPLTINMDSLISAFSSLTEAHDPGRSESVDLAEEMKNLSGYMMGGFQPSDSETLKNGLDILSELPRIAEEIKSNPAIQEMKSSISKGEFTIDDLRKMQEGMSGLVSSVFNGKISEEEIEEQKQDSAVVLERLNEIKMSDSETVD